nr:hypothetical protein [Tanacetum cinerariifolium]
TKDNNNAGQARKEKEPSKYYILLPLWTADPPFPQEPKNQEEKDIVNNTNRVNVVSSTLNAASNEVNDVGRKLSIKLPDGLNMLKLEDISIFEDSNKDVFGAEVDLNNLESTFQGHTQEEGIDYDEVFALVTRIEAIRFFLAYASFKEFVVYQMDVKSAFLYEKIKKEREMIDKTLFIKRDKSDILLVHVYVDDIIFGSTRKEMYTEFEKIMHKRLKMSSIGELTFFLRLQVKQKEDGIFISQNKYVNEILNKFSFSDVKTANTPLETDIC